MVRKNKGRQKIEMVKMKNENNLQVTFSKRKSGLFKKASELCTLCNAEVGIIVFSPARKVFSFGHPNVDVVIDRFLNLNPPYPHQPDDIQLNESRRNTMIQDLNNYLTQVNGQLEVERKRNEYLKQKKKDSKNPENWWEEEHIERFNFTQLTEFKSGLENLRKAVTNEASRYLQATAPCHDHLYVGSSSRDPAFGIHGDDSYINTELDLFNHQRMVSTNTFNYSHHNMIDPNHTSPFGNDENIVEGSIPESNQNQRQCLKQENISENDHPPQF